MFRRPTLSTLARIRNLGTLTWANEGSTSPKPFVVLLGWAFSAPQQLDRYRFLYQRLGHDSLTYTFGARDFFTFDQKAQWTAAQTLTQVIKTSNGNPERKIIVHAFSNNGYSIYVHLANMICTPESSMKLSGAILDSGPSPFSFLSYLPRLGALGLRLRPNRHFLPVANFTVNVTSEGLSFSTALDLARDVQSDCRENWDKYAARFYCPQEHASLDRRRYPLLFLYSRKDWMVPTGFIDGIVALQTDLGRKVDSHDFNESMHCAHLKTFPQTYEQQVRSFLAAL